ncbi:D-alanyl-D-alanine carboxypeptidase [Mangrovicella endophytica]|uniref:D-alanyl-D-alanine carboxypeptidase n=1 Tax=Mangrovicella endophytica TaxID=2066697 RepID=UPI001FE11602|nr:D-alanyl-D-alanine carboxypeptidase [Mangrovicella endophytica]
MRQSFEGFKSIAVSVTRTAGAAALGATILMQAPAAQAAPERYAAFVIDANNGNVLYARNADDYRYPASLTKMMTLYMLFEQIQNGRMSLSTPMKVSSYASTRAPSKLGLRPGSSLTAEEAILGLVTKSANDAAAVIAEHIGGSEERFAEMMTAKARRLGMSKTTFRNANGLPNPAQKTTARDMATLGIALREHFPSQYKYFSTRSFNFRGQVIGNHNRVLRRVEGADGIKTGYINASGFNLVTSVATGNKKLVGVVMGGATAKSRDDEMVKLVTKYLPQASGRAAGEPLIASRPEATTPRVTMASVDLPKRGPVPDFRAASEEDIDQRVALAYGSGAAGAVAAMPVPARKPLVGRQALRAALVSEEPVAMPSLRQQFQRPVSNRSLGAPMPPASIPGGVDLDPGTTGSVARAAPASAYSAAPSSAYVVQIAAVPTKDGAMAMLAEAQRKSGSALASAQPFTETVGNLYRARFAGFDSKEQANRACVALKKSSYSCYAVAN